jgi:thiol-disulfide isomerase/thioredoxin
MLLLFCIFLLFGLKASDVVIQGKANQPGLLIRLILTEDHISGAQKLLASTKTDFRGRFELRAVLDKPSYAQIAAGPDRADLLILPGCTYTIQLDDQPDFEQLSYYEREPLRYQLVSANDKGAADQLLTVNLIVNTFILQHFNDLYKRRSKALTDTLRAVIKQRIPSFAHNYVDEYTRYKIASIELASHQMSNEAIIERYIKNQTVLYGNIEYMGLFNQIFNAYINNSRLWGQDDIKEHLYKGMSSMKSLLRRDLLLANDEKLLELVLLVNLRHIYFDRSFDQNDIKEVLNQLATASAIPEHRLIAAGILKVNGHLSFGSQAPELTLADHNQDFYTVRELTSDRITILNFVKNDCQPCVAGFDDLQKLNEEYGENVRIVTIATRLSFQETRKIFLENRYQWLLLDLADHWTVLEDYNIKSFPEFIVLLPGSRVGMAPAPSPERGLESHIQRLMRQVKTN